MALLRPKAYNNMGSYDFSKKKTYSRNGDLVRFKVQSARKELADNVARCNVNVEPSNVNVETLSQTLSSVFLEWNVNVWCLGAAQLIYLAAKLYVLTDFISFRALFVTVRRDREKSCLLWLTGRKRVSFEAIVKSRYRNPMFPNLFTASP